MAKLTKTTVFREHTPKPETAMEKTARIAKEIVVEEVEQRQAKIARLRNTRLERESSTPAKATATAAHKTRRSKAVAKR